MTRKSRLSQAMESQLITYGKLQDWKKLTARERPDARVLAGGTWVALARRTPLFQSAIRLPGVTLKNNPRRGSMLWYSRSMLCSHGSSQLSPSDSTNVSSNHFLVIQSTPPIRACRLCGIASKTKPQFSKSQLVSALR